jgi:hypothetical protein
LCSFFSRKPALCVDQDKLNLKEEFERRGKSMHKRIKLNLKDEFERRDKSMHKRIKLEKMPEREENDHAASSPRWIWIKDGSETEESSIPLLNDQAPQVKGKVQQQGKDSEEEAENQSWMPEEGQMEVSSHSETSYNSNLSGAIVHPWAHQATHKQQSPLHPWPPPVCNRITQSVMRHQTVKNLMSTDAASRCWNDGKDDDARQPDYYWDDNGDSDSSSDGGGYQQAVGHGTKNVPQEPATDDQMRAYLGEFSSWLGTISGGLHNPSTARNYTLYVARMLSSQGTMTDSILGVRRLAMPGGYLDQQLQLRAPTTVRAYIAALGAFFEFLREEHSEKFNTDFCVNAESLFRRWSSGLQRKVAKRRCERPDLDEPLMAQVVKLMALYKGMDHRRGAITALETMQSNHCTPSRKDYLLVQKYLIISLLIANAWRGGSIVHAKITEWKPKPFSAGQHAGYSIKVGNLSVFHACAGDT